MKDLSNYRKSYEKGALSEAEIPENPISLFRDWFEQAEKSEAGETNAMTVSTIGLDGFPKARVVLLKQISEEGFVFFTNYQSEKGRAITANPHVCLSFFWQSLERQVIIKGVARQTSEFISDDYFRSRPEGSKLSAVVSDQSETVPSREYLEEKLKNIASEFANREIQRPNYWGGYLVTPIQIEFWQGRKNRLHDRIRYSWTQNRWLIGRIAP